MYSVYSLCGILKNVCIVRHGEERIRGGCFIAGGAHKKAKQKEHIEVSKYPYGAKNTQ